MTVKDIFLLCVSVVEMKVLWQIQDRFLLLAILSKLLPCSKK